MAATAPIAKPPDVLCTSLFVFPPPKSFECSICTNVMRDSCVACPSFHSFCRGCITTWKKRSNQCPRCKVKLLTELKSNVDLAGSIDETVVYCFTRRSRPADEENEGPAAASDTSSTAEAADADSDEGKSVTSDGSGAKKTKGDWTGPLAQAGAHFQESSYVLDLAGSIDETEAYCIMRSGRPVNEEDGTNEAPSAGGKRKAAASGGRGKGAKAPEVNQCEWKGPLAQAKAHLNKCPFAGVTCSHEGCSAVVTRSALEDHEEGCEHQKQCCKWGGCDDKVKRVEKEEHELTCRKRLVACPHAAEGCDAGEMCFEAVAVHVEADCSYAEVPCPFASAGCPARMLRKDVEAHEDAAIKQHNRLLMKESVGQEERAVEQEERMEGLVEKVKEQQSQMEWQQRKMEGLQTQIAGRLGAFVVVILVLVLVLQRALHHVAGGPFAGMGCPARMPRQDMEAHENDAMVVHNRLLLVSAAQREEHMKQMQGLMKKVEEQQGQIEEQQGQMKGLMKKVEEQQQQIEEQQGQVQGLQRALRYVAGGEVIVIKVKHALLTGAEPFEPRHLAQIYSEGRVVDDRTFSLFVDTKVDDAPDHYGLYLALNKGPVPCKVRCTFELVHHDGQAASAKKVNAEDTYDKHQAWGWKNLIPKARLASAANNPYVKDGYVTFKCTFEVVA